MMGESFVLDLSILLPGDAAPGEAANSSKFCWGGKLGSVLEPSLLPTLPGCCSGRLPLWDSLITPLQLTAIINCSN